MRPRRRARNLAPLLAAVLALAGCAGAEPGFSGGCPLDPVAQVPVHLYSGLPLIDGTIAGKPVRMVLDTGADRTLLSEAAVRRLGLRRDSRATRSAGIGGSFAAFDALAGAIHFGNVSVPLSSVVVGNFALGLSESQVDGLLGADLWRQLDVDLDLPARTATFYRAQLCRRSAPPWPGPAIGIAGLPGPANRLLLPAALDGQGAVAIFDTGAQVSGVSFRLAARTAEADAPARDVRVRGAGASVAKLKARRFASFRVGPLLFNNPVLPVLPLPQFADALVGQDMLRGCRAWFSFAARQLFLAAPEMTAGQGGHITLACPQTSP